jgi:glyoxylase-like metal-dependent hydrolase (beta-lactamase superfamily II)
MSYASWDVRADLTALVLPKPGLPAPFGTPSNVYLLHGPQPALLGTGHPRSRGALLAALAERGLAPRDIRRVAALDWSPDQLGNAALFGRASCFVLSPDLQAPARYGAWVEGQRAGWLDDGRALRQDPAFEAAMPWEPFEAAVEAYFADTPTALDMIPVRDGHALRLGQRLWEVVDTPGPCEGHMALLDRADRTLCAGRLSVERMYGDLQVQAVQPYLRSVERVFDLKPRLALPSAGRPDEDGAGLLRRANRSLTTRLSNLPFVLQGVVTAPELLRRDLGYLPSQLGRALEAIRTTQACLDELVRTGATRHEGRGVWARYGATAPAARFELG